MAIVGTTYTSGIWKTPEADAWSRGFDYKNYVYLHELYFKKGLLRSEPLIEIVYLRLCEAFHLAMVDYLKWIPDGHSSETKEIP